MTAPTHKQYAISFSFILAMLLQFKGLTQINYYLSLPIIILISKYGGLFPDIDHTWRNVKEKTVPNWIINKIIHMTGGKHRSWQTHSIDIVVIVSILSYILPDLLFKYEKISSVNREVLSIILLSFCCGWISHIIADMMTSAGVRLFFWNKKIIIRLVPKHIGKLRFNTGHEWESFVYTAVKKTNIILGVICLIFPLIYNGTIENVIKKILEVMA